MADYKKLFRLKCRYEGEIRSVTVNQETVFIELKKRLTSDYGFEVSLKYEDRDGDYITLASQNDFDDMLVSAENDTINTIVSEAIILPNLQTKGAATKTSTTSSLFNANANLSREWSAHHSTSNSSSGILPLKTGRIDRFPVINDGSHHGIRPESQNIRWKRGDLLGQGAFGKVFLGLNIETGELMAVKQIATEEVSKRELSALENEINLLRNLLHPNIVRYIGTELNNVSLSILLEYVPGGSLRSLIDKFGELEESVAKSYTRQLLIGLEYLHRNGIAHRDIKGANCLVGNDGNVKLADFGNSRHWRPTNTTGGSTNHSTGDIKGTPSWMAPEVIRDQGGAILWKKADIWSLACTTIEMTTGKPPWKQFNNSVTILYHLACQDTLPEFPEPASIELLTFLNTSLQRDPLLRPDVTSLLLHPFVATNIHHPTAYGAGSAFWNTGGSNFSNFNNRPSTVSSTHMGDWGFNPSHTAESRDFTSLAGQSMGLDLQGITTPQALSTGNIPSEASPFRNTSSSGPVPPTSARLSSSQPAGAADSHQYSAMRRQKSRSGSLHSRNNSLDVLLPSDTRSSPRPNPSPFDLQAGGASHAPSQDTTPRVSTAMSVIPPLNLGNTSGFSSLHSERGVSSRKSSRHGHVEVSEKIVADAAAVNLLAVDNPEVTHEVDLKAVEMAAELSNALLVSDIQDMRGNTKNADAPTPPIAEAKVKEDTRSSQSKEVMSSKQDVVTKKSPSPPQILNQIMAKPVGGKLTPIPPQVSGNTNRINKSKGKNGTRKGVNRTASSIPNAALTTVPTNTSTPAQSDEEKTSGARPNRKRAESLNPSALYPSGPDVNSKTPSSSGPPPIKEKAFPTIEINKKLESSLPNNFATSPKDFLSMPAPIHPISDAQANSFESIPTPIFFQGDSGNCSDETGSLLGQHAPIWADQAAEVDVDTTCFIYEDELDNLSVVEEGILNKDLVNLDFNTSDFREEDSLLLDTSNLVPSPMAAQKKSVSVSNTPQRSRTAKKSKESSSVGVSPVHRAKSEQFEDEWSSLDNQDLKPKGKSVSPVLRRLDHVDSMDSLVEISAAATGEEIMEDFVLPPHFATSDARKDDSFYIPKHKRNERVMTGAKRGASASNANNAQDISKSINVSSLSRGSASAGPIKGSVVRKSMEATGSPVSRHKNTRYGKSGKEEGNFSSMDMLDMSTDSLQITGTATGGNRPGTFSRQFSRQNVLSRQPSAVVLSMDDGSSVDDEVEDCAYVDHDDDDNQTNYKPEINIDTIPETLDEHTAAVVRLRVPRKYPKNLLSASVDGTIRLWGEGEEESFDYQSSYRRVESRLVLDTAKFMQSLSSSEQGNSVTVESKPERKFSANADRVGTAYHSESPASQQVPYSAGNSGQGRSGGAIKILNMWAEETCDTIWAACNDATLRVWGGGGGGMEIRPLRLLRGHEEAVTAMEGIDAASAGAPSASSCLVATGSVDRTVRIWDARAKKSQVFMFRGHGDTVLTLRWGDDGRTLISAGKDKSVRVWDTRAGRARLTMEKHFGSVTALRVVSSGLNNKHNGNVMIGTLTGGNTGNNLLKNEEPTLVSAGRDATIKVWSSGGDCLSSLTAHRGSVAFLSEIRYASIHHRASTPFTPQNSYTSNCVPLMISVGSDSALKVWDMKRCRCVSEISPSVTNLSQPNLSSVPPTRATTTGVGNINKVVWCGAYNSFITGSNTGVVKLYEHVQQSATTETIGMNEQNDSLMVGTKSEKNPSGASSSQWEWNGRELTGSHTQACTDLLCSSGFLASSSRSGQILRWTFM